MDDNNYILSLLDNFTLDNPDEIAKDIAADFRRRRVEKNLTRDQLAEKAEVAVSNLVRFEQKGLISLRNLISLAMALGYTSEVKNIFAKPKFSTMEELATIRRNSSRKKAYRK
jgi:transcriptional regulator with XRE-family HTH domain